MAARNCYLAICVMLMAGCPGQVEEVPAQWIDGREADSGAAGYRVVTVVEGLEHPWGMAFLPGDEGILVTERPGRLRLVRDGRLVPEPIAGLPAIRGEGEGGLLDVALHPNFVENRLVYISYSKPGPRGATTALARGRLLEGRLQALEDVFVAEAWAPAAVNYGGRIVFDGEGHVYLSVGDRRAAERARDLRDHVGTTVRLLEDGGVPPDNPFVGRPDIRPEIYTYGNRNPQGMVLDRGSGRLWQNDHGPRGGDRIHLVRPGADYGWPDVSYGDHYDGRPIPDPSPGDGTDPPVHYWNPGISPSGLTLYDGAAFPAWRGDLFSGSLVARRLVRLRLEGERVTQEERLLGEVGQRIRAVVTGPDGLIYLLLDTASAPLLRLEPAGVG
jgi:aldose sugar dehydrogenase